MGILPVAKKEFAENFRNAWILAMTGAFLLVTLVATLVTDAFEVGGGLERVRAVTSGIRWASGLLLPIMALMLGHGTLAGERESGSLGLLVAQPLTRAHIVLGKYLGLFAALALAFLVGGGGSALYVALTSGAGAQGLSFVLVFVLATLAWGASWTAITLLLSAFFARRGTAVWGSLLAWFTFSLLWVPITLAVVASTGTFTSQFEEPQVPGWLILLQLLNPNAAWGGLLSHTIGGAPGLVGQIVASVLPDLGSAPLFAVALALWIALPLAGALALFRSRDI